MSTVVSQSSPKDPALVLPTLLVGHRQRARRPWLMYLSIGWLTLVGLAALTAQWLPIADYRATVGRPREPVFSSLGEIFGTDNYGRSILARVIVGARTSLLLSLLSVSIAIVLGGLIGLWAGYRGGWFDRIVAFPVDTMLAFPPLVFLLTLTVVLRPSFSTLLIGLTVVIVPTFIRLERASARSYAQRPFVLASEAYGAGRARIVFREILPNAGLVLITYVPAVVATLIIAEGSLSFLGLGIPPPTPSWGGMIADGKAQLRVAPHMVFVPAACVFLTVFALSIIGERFRSRYER